MTDDLGTSDLSSPATNGGSGDSASALSVRFNGVTESGEREGSSDDPLRSISSWRRPVDSGLSVQPSDAKGSGWRFRLRPNGELVEAFPSMRDEARGERAEPAFSF